MITGHLQLAFSVLGLLEQLVCVFPDLTLLFKKLTCTLLWIILTCDVYRNWVSCIVFSFVKLRRWGARRPRLCLIRNSRHIPMTSTWKDYPKTFLLEVPHGMESQDWRKSFKWAIELSLLLKGKIIIHRNKCNVVLKKRFIAFIKVGLLFPSQLDFLSVLKLQVCCV